MVLKGEISDHKLFERIKGEVVRRIRTQEDKKKIIRELFYAEKEIN